MTTNTTKSRGIRLNANLGKPAASMADLLEIVERRKTPEQAAQAAQAAQVQAAQVQAAHDTQAAQAQAQAAQGIKMDTFYRLLSSPAGKALFTYWLAIMAILGGFTPARRPMKRDRIRAFFATNSVLSHHTKNGNLEDAGDGMVRLTITGWNYFQGRLNGSTIGQSVDAMEMDAMQRAIRSGSIEQTARFGPDTKFVSFKVMAQQ